MDRRHFVAGSAVAALGGVRVGAAAASQTGSASSEAAARPILLELRRYRLRTGTMATRFGAYVKDALVPALVRLRHEPVGVFNVMLGADSPTLHLLVPHAGAEAVATLGERLSADGEYRKAAAELLALPSGDPPYLRCDSSLHAAVPGFPRVERPVVAASRLFELRTYRSHSEPASRKKIEMFETMGELAIFKRLGLGTVFFSRDVVGEGLPSLTYMLVFADAAAREKAWAAFRDDAEWQKLRSTPGYADAEVVCGITSVLLRPAECSQI